MKALTSVDNAAIGYLHDNPNKVYASFNIHVPHDLAISM